MNSDVNLRVYSRIDATVTMPGLLGMAAPSGTTNCRALAGQPIGIVDTRNTVSQTA